MIDFANIENYKENNRIEAKRALGGLPHSIWETYSAFANTLGGIILLGVEERSDKTLHAVNLPDPERLVAEFWALVGQRKKVSANILSDSDVSIESVNGCRIIAIRVPRAHRTDKPIFIDGDVMLGTYRRGGEGDYRCTKEEVFSMMRDSRVKTQDMAVLENMDIGSLDPDGILHYKSSMEDSHRGVFTSELDDLSFLERIGAVRKSDDGLPRPTAAGLLMLGRAEEIRRAFPNFSLEYTEMENGKTLHEISFADGCENIYTFFYSVCQRLARYGLEHGEMYACMREALANCLVNADYYGELGIAIYKTEHEITFTNPGGFRVDVESAKAGGVSDPRNSALAKMFSLIDACKGLGGGISGIYGVWKRLALPVPTIRESFDPDAITLCLVLTEKREKFLAGRGLSTENVIYRESIVLYLTDNVCASCRELASLLGISMGRVRAILRSMTDGGIITPEGNGKNRKYRLKR